MSRWTRVLGRPGGVQEVQRLGLRQLLRGAEMLRVTLDGVGLEQAVLNDLLADRHGVLHHQVGVVLVQGMQGVRLGEQPQDGAVRPSKRRAGMYECLLLSCNYIYHLHSLSMMHETSLLLGICVW